jgi:hypothetical protein
MANGDGNCGSLLTNHKFPRMNRTAHCENNAFKWPTKLTTSLCSKRYRPSGIQIYRQKGYATCSWQCTGHHELQRRELVNKGKNFPVYIQMIYQFYDLTDFPSMVTCLNERKSQFSHQD